MSNRTNRKTQSFVSFLIALFIVVVIFGLFYKAGNPLIRHWAGIFGVGKVETLAGTAWTWQKTDMRNGTTITAPGGNLYVLSFNADGRLASTTDCNSLFADYSSSKAGMLRVGPVTTTDISCGLATLETQYAEQLRLANSFSVAGNALTIKLADNAGTMYFVKR